MKILAVLFALVLALVLPGCATPSVVQLSPDTYLITKNVGGQIAGGLAATKAAVIQQANDFAQQQGKIAVVISSKETPPNFYSLGVFEYQFRVVDRNDPEARRTSLIPRPDVVIEKTEKSSMQTKSVDAKTGDFYSDLTKLDELRKKGILTEEEFATQKKKLLER